MSYTLGGLTLPQPKKLTRSIIEDATENTRIYGATTKNYRNIKEQFILEYYYLSFATINSILSLYELGQALDFTVDEGGLEIATTKVLMDVSNVNYPEAGETWREDFVITLTEVI